MSAPDDHPPPIPEDPDQTRHVPAPSPSDLLRANAGHILGDMLDMGIAGTECEGDSIGPYRLCEIIGEGGFGNVWRAEQTEVVKREVALKVIKLGMDTAQVLGRFNQERQALAALEHPNIATMLDAGVGPNGRPYFAMELVRGGAITSWCAEHDATLEERLRLFIQVCLAVQHAHEKGILHRDIKPTNVLVSEVDGAPVPKVIDFGIAKAMHSVSLNDITMLTQEDQVIGTPVYMSPEQIEGGRRLDARSDVYALGALLYEMLTGAQPFDTTRISQGGPAAVKQLILETNPERPSTRLRQKTSSTKRGAAESKALLSALPTDLDWITMKALEKDRLRRYQTAAEFAADVQRHLDSVPVMARPPSLGYIAGRWLRRHRRGVITAGIGAVASGVVASAVMYYQAEQAKKPKPIVLDAKGHFTNDIGMKFVDVPGTDVLMCIHETRHKDYEAYVAEVPGAMGIWSNGVERGLDPMVEDRGNHPVIRVNWGDAKSFCDWLSRKEGRVYRLPTDREWSYAVGIGEDEEWTKETTPSTIFRHPTAFPWGSVWPPPDGVGNFSDETRMQFAPADQPYFKGRTDGYFTTAPVMSFKPNKLGIYDLSGNIHEWVEDWWDATRQSHASRGGSWGDAKRENLLSSFRSGTNAVANPAFGFRCVLERRPTFHADPTPVIVERPTPKFPKSMTPEQAAKTGLTNSLGMKFVPIPGTNVLFCIHETRRQDYAAFDKEVPQSGAGLQWKNQRWGDEPTGMGDDHPVSGVNWHEAQSFCTWLSKKEGHAYRLPTDAEWSIAVGIGELEALTRDSTPTMLSGIAPGAFPYGTGFPPLPGQKAGNYADLSHRRVFPTADVLEQYDDGFVTSAPVMSFPPNPFGLYDMGGNVNEWTSSWTSLTQTHRVLRGGSWEEFSIDGLRSGRRFSVLPVTHRASYGFRLALESDLPDPNLPPPTKFPDPLPEAEMQARSVTNSLGMKFVPVPGSEVLFCIHETRRQDYAVYASHFANSPGLSNAWQIQHKEGHPVSAEDDHPVVAVSWEDAKAFCDWLSRKEDRLYRLPTDREWSIATGLGPYESADKTPEQLGQAGRKEFAHAGTYPPRGKAGNYADEAYRQSFPTQPALTGYEDGFATTAPVMSFKANPFGIFDLGGNVSEWCEDLINPGDKRRGQRGSTWVHHSLPDLASAKRFPEAPNLRNFRYGFRCVLVPGGKAPPLTGKETLKPDAPPPPIEPPHPGAISALQALSQPKFPETLTLVEAEPQAVTNSLGMKLLPVGGTGVLFCIHETRYKDYAAYAESNPKADAKWKNQVVDGVQIDGKREEHPAHSVSWQDAQDFCAWLSAKEGRTYRLPTDREWSFAAGIGSGEEWKQDTTPQTVFKVQNHFPWEGPWPPPASSGNLFDETRHSKVPRPNTIPIEGYDDGYASTAPVMNYQPNSKGIYDMAGNVWEWCEDAYDHDRLLFPQRGGSWSIPSVAWSHSSFRQPHYYTHRSPTEGFRIVLEP
jgi:formylglycine-generating enzyme required for sulfatase activity/serine/threonine protein kinase